MHPARSLATLALLLLGACQCGSKPSGTISPMPFDRATFAGKTFLTVSPEFETRDGALIARIVSGTDDLRFVLVGGAEALENRSGRGEGRIEATGERAATAFGEGLLAQLGWKDRKEIAPNRTRSRAPLPFDWEVEEDNGSAIFVLAARAPSGWARIELSANPLIPQLGFAIATPNDPQSEWLWALAHDLRYGSPNRILASAEPLLVSDAPLLALPATTSPLPPACTQAESTAWSPTDLVCASREAMAITSGPPFELTKVVPFGPFPRGVTTSAIALAHSPVGRRLLVDAVGGPASLRTLSLVDLATRQVVWSKVVAGDRLLAPHWSPDGSRLVVRSERWVPDGESSALVGDLELLDAATGATTARLTVPESTRPLGFAEDAVLLVDSTEPKKAPGRDEDGDDDEWKHTPVQVRPEEPVTTAEEDQAGAHSMSSWKSGHAAAEPIATSFRTSPFPGGCRLEWDASKRSLSVNGRPLPPLRRRWYDKLVDAFSAREESTWAWFLRLTWIGSCHVVLRDVPRDDEVVLNLETGRWRYLFPEGDAFLRRLRSDGRQALVSSGGHAGVVDVPAELP